MSRCIAIVSDMIFATRITGTAAQMGADCTVVVDQARLQVVLGSDPPELVFVDMNCAGISPDEAIRTVKSWCPAARVIAYYSHVQTELLERATAAGADDVWPRSAFVQRLPQVLKEVSPRE